MYLTYIGLVILVLTLALVLTVIVIHKYETSSIRISNNSVITCENVKCVVKTLREILERYYCNANVRFVKVRGICSVLRVRKNTFYICCDNVCRFIMLKCR